MLTHPGAHVLLGRIGQWAQRPQPAKRPQPPRRRTPAHTWTRPTPAIARLQLAIEKSEAHPVMEGKTEAPSIPRGGLDPRAGKSGYKEVFDPMTIVAVLTVAGT